MTRIHTRTLAALVVDLQSLGNLTVLQFIRHSMGVQILKWTPGDNKPIPVFTETRRPEPASCVRLGDALLFKAFT